MTNPPLTVTVSFEQLVYFNLKIRTTSLARSFVKKANDLEVFIIFIYLDESQNCGFSEDDVKEDTAVQSLSLSNRSFWSL